MEQLGNGSQYTKKYNHALCTCTCTLYTLTMPVIIQLQFGVSREMPVLCYSYFKQIVGNYIFQITVTPSMDIIMLGTYTKAFMFNWNAHRFFSILDTFPFSLFHHFIVLVAEWHYLRQYEFLNIDS